MRLVFIAGWMRSGTTLFTELLGSCAGALAVGELTQLWAALDRGNPCSCGHPVPECPIWSAVAAQVLERHDIGPGASTSYLEFHDIVAGVMRTRRMPMLRKLRRGAPEVFPHDVRRVVDVMSTVFQVIEEASGATVTVDSSKRAVALFVFGLVPDLDITPLHLVRDPRAVAFSESRASTWDGVSQALAPPGRKLIPSALGWSASWLTCHLIGHGFPGYRELRYEALAAHPAAVLSSVASGLAVAPPSFPTERSVQLAPSHVVDGNPSRFGSRLRTITADERWRAGMSTKDRLVVTLITAPFQLARKVTGQ